MATFYIVADNTKPLGPNQIAAGSTIQVHEGDVFIFEAGANKTTTFTLANGAPNGANFDIQFNTSNTAGAFDVKVSSNLNVDISVANNVDIDNININASNASSTTFTAGDGVSLKSFTGSANGPDTVTIGDNATVTGIIDTKAGNDSLTIGDNGHFHGDIKLGAGVDNVSIGSGNTFYKAFNLEAGNDIFTAGNGNTFLGLLEGGDGADSLTFGQNNTITSFNGGKDADTVIVGYVDPNVVQLIDAVDHNPGTVIDTLQIDVSADKAGFEQLLISHGYVQDVDGSWNATKNTDFHIKWHNVQINDFEKIIICFARGTEIDTSTGRVKIEDLAVGDLVMTLDSGPQPVRWIGARTVVAEGDFAPVLIRKGTLGNDRDLLVSPQHRFLLTGPRYELHFGEPEVLATAKSLINDGTITRQEGGEVEYFHLLFDKHEIVFAEGTPAESFYPGPKALTSMEVEVLAEILTLFPELSVDPQAYGAEARPLLRPWEAEIARRDVA